MSAAKKPNVVYELRRELLASSLILWAICAFGWYNISKGDAILDCMAEKGDIHSKINYAECVGELK